MYMSTWTCVCIDICMHAHVQVHGHVHIVHRQRCGGEATGLRLQSCDLSTCASGACECASMPMMIAALLVKGVHRCTPLCQWTQVRPWTQVQVRQGTWRYGSGETCCVSFCLSSCDSGVRARARACVCALGLSARATPDYSRSGVRWWRLHAKIACAAVHGSFSSRVLGSEGYWPQMIFVMMVKGTDACVTDVAEPAGRRTQT